MEPQSLIPGQLIIDKNDPDFEQIYIYAVIKGGVKLIGSDERQITAIKQN